MNYKCGKCREYKSRDLFYPTNRSGRGVSNYCRECEKARKRIVGSTRRSSASGISKTLTPEEYRREYYLRNRESIREKQKEYFKQYYSNNAEARRRKRAVYHMTDAGRLSSLKSNHKRRQLLKLSSCTLSIKDITIVLDAQGNACAKCSRKFDKNLKYTIDHILPLSKGGKLAIGNMQLLCKSCNSSKGTKCIKYRDDLVYDFMED